jgi:hypothetical protein
VTWLPAVCQVPADANLCDICEEILRGSSTAMYSVSEQQIRKHKLESLTDQKAASILQGSGQ